MSTTTADFETPRALHAECNRRADALTHHRPKLPSLRDAREVRAKELADADTALALADAAGDTAATRKAEASAKTALTALREAESSIERAERVEIALVAACHAADEALAAALPALRSEVQAHGRDLTLALAAELIEATQPLIAWMRRADVWGTAARLHHVANYLHAVTVPDMASGGSLLAGGLVRQADGSHVPLRATDADRAAVPDTVGAPAALLAELEAYRPRTAVVKAPEPYQRRGYTLGARINAAEPVAADDSQASSLRLPSSPPPAAAPAPYVKKGRTHMPEQRSCAADMRAQAASEFAPRAPHGVFGT